MATILNFNKLMSITHKQESCSLHVSTHGIQDFPSCLSSDNGQIASLSGFHVLYLQFLPKLLTNVRGDALKDKPTIGLLWNFSSGQKFKT